MRVSVNVTNYSWPGGSATTASGLADVARAADEAGLNTMWVADHLIQMDPFSSPDDSMLEAYTTLGFLAGRTERIRLGTMVSAVTFRPPALLIKAVTTLDVLSGGRAVLGIGAGYTNEEAQNMGLSLPPVAERYERLKETLRLAVQMWRGDDSPFEGRHYQLSRPVNQPPPVRRPPILVGGSGEQKTLRLVAQYADACNLFDIPDGGATIRHKLDVLASHCHDVGRPYEEIDKTVSTALQPGESPDAFAERCGNLRDLGVDHVVVITRGQPWTTADVTTLAPATSL